MNFPTPALLCAAFVLLATAGCAQTAALPDAGPLSATSNTVTVTGAYKPVTLDSVDHITIENGKLVLHGASATATVDLPPSADPDQKNRGWALVTEGEDDASRTLTFTQEMTLEDFTLTVPPAQGQVAYGSLGGRDGKDVLLFAYGSNAKVYWGWVSIQKRAGSAAQ